MGREKVKSAPFLMKKGVAVPGGYKPVFHLLLPAAHFAAVGNSQHSVLLRVMVLC
jgi:hypothetical protein